MPRSALKEEAHRLIDTLPDEATWDDVKYVIYLRQQVKEGRESARAEPTMTLAEVRKSFGLDPDRRRSRSLP
jgi:hypothetical protein